MNKSKLLLLLAIGLSFGLFFYFDLGSQFSLETIKAQQYEIEAFYASNVVLTVVCFYLVYVVVTGLSLPGAATVMTLLAGAVFGLLYGTIIVSFASTMGATVAFLSSRFILKDWAQSKFPKQFETINEGLEKDGAFYLLTLRIVPALPFFVINIMMGLTSIPVRTYYWVSQIGMLAGTVVYVNAGTELAKLDSLSGILSPSLFGSLVLLGVFPTVAVKSLEWLKSKKVYQDYQKPKSFDANMVVIGAGAAGLVNAYIGSAVKAKVVLIEKHKMGGDCLNYGCVPSKALIKTTKLLEANRQSNSLGIHSAKADFNFSDVMDRIERVVAAIEPHDSQERYEGLGVECITGDAKIISPWQVEVNGKVITTKNITIASGAAPFVPPIPGLDAVDYYTSDTLWGLRELPKRMVVLGGGPIGCELTQSFSRLGAEVTQIEMLDRIMAREDVDVSDLVQQKFESEGVRVLTQHKVVRFYRDAGQNILECEHSGQTIKIEFDAVLVAVGRAARTKGFGLEELGVELTDRGTVKVNPYLQTNYPNIYAAGDVAGPYQFTHTAAHMAWYTSVNALFGVIKKFKVDYSVIPWATFTDPEVARCGLNELEAKEKGIAYDLTHYGVDDLDRAIADEVAHGFVKVLTKPGSDTILGVTIVAEHSAEMVAEFVLAMKHGLGLNKILGTIHIYPTMSEANKYVAGEWKRSKTSEKMLAWLQRFHRWRRT